MKRVGVISYFCPPVLNAEAILVWKTLGWLSRTHDVTVFAASIFAQACDPDLVLQENVQIKRHPDLRMNGRFARRVGNRLIGMFADEHVFWTRISDEELKRQSFDVLYSRSQPGASHILAKRVKDLMGIPWVAQLNDPWASNPYNTAHTKIRKQFDRKHEATVIAHADHLIFPTKEILEMYEDQYSDMNIASRSTILHHHTSPDLYTKREGRLDGSENRISFAYFGDFYGLRSPEPIIRAWEHLIARRPELREHATLHFLGNIQAKFLPIVDRSPIPVKTGRMSYLESLSAMTKSDVLLLIDAPNDSGRTPFLPSKLIDYLGAGRPILGITEPVGTAPDILRSFGYPVVTPREPMEISRHLEHWLDHGGIASSKPTHDFESSVVVARLAQILETVQRSRP